MPKITDPSKLLPSAKSTSIVKTSKGNLSSFIKTSKIVNQNKTTTEKKSLVTNDIKNIEDKLFSIEKFLKSDFLSTKKKKETKRKEKEKQDFEEAEKKLETPQSKKLKLPSASLPSIGLFERIKRFLFFTALGWLVPKIIEFVPKLQGVFNIIGGVYNFAEGLFGKLFDGFMSLVKFGGDLKKQTLGFIAQLKVGPGGDYEAEFKKLQSQFDTFINASIIAGVLSADIGLAAVDEYNKWKKRNKPPGKPKPGEPPKKTPKKSSAKVTQGKGGQPPSGKAKVTKSKPGKAPSWWDKMLRGPFAKLKGPLSRFAGAAVPGLGAAVGAADAAARFAAGDKIGGSIASVSAGIDGISTILLATGVGAPVAAALSAVSIGLDAILLINDIGKVIKETWPMMGWLPTFSKGGRIVRKYQGGGTAGRPVGVPKKRTITPTIKKPPKIKPPKTQPGKDVGGEKKIKKLYPDTSFSNWQSWTSATDAAGNPLAGTFEQNQKRPNPFKALTTTAKELKRKGLFGLEWFMGGAVDIALGQKMDVKKAVNQFSYGIGYLIDTLANQRVNESVSSIARHLQSFSNGGTIKSSRQIETNYNSINSGNLISKILEPTLRDRVNESIKSIEKEIQKIQEKKKGEKPPSADPYKGGLRGDGETSVGDAMLPGDAPPEVKAMLDAIAGAEGGWNSVNPSTTISGLSNMTIAEARLAAIRKGIGQLGGSGAMGKFQQMPDFILSRARAAGLDPYKDKFTPENQTKIARMLMAGVYPGGESQLIKDARKDPLKAAANLRGTWPSLPGGTQENVHTRGFLSRYNSAIKTYESGVTPSSQSKVLTSGGIVPSQGRITSTYGSQESFREGPHTGIDYGYNVGTPISLVKSGEVVEALKGYNRGYGNFILVKHNDGTYSMFNHLNDIYVTKGQKINASTGSAPVIGTIGNTGYSTGPHLDFKVATKWDGFTPGGFVDPRGYQDNVFRIGGNVQIKPSQVAKLAIKDGKEGVIENGVWKPKNWTAEERQRYSRVNPQTSKPSQQTINTSGMTNQQISDKIRNIKPGQKIVFTRVGSVQGGKDWMGRPQTKYFDPQGNPLTEQQFIERYRASTKQQAQKSQPRPNQSPAPGGPIAPRPRETSTAEQLRQRGISVQGRLQGGGLIGQPKSKLPIPNSFASYESPGSGMMIAIQPIYIKTPSYSSRSDSVIAFPVPVMVNSSEDMSSRRG